jgi:DNA-binding transcriptional regulator PaaX
MKLLLMAGVLVIAAQSPYAVRSFLKAYKNWRKYSAKKITDTFANLKRQGFIEIERRGPQIYIRLTQEGRKKAGMFQIDSLKIKRQKKWDKKWRLVIFDIAQIRRIHREALRGKLKELRFYCLQKSVWVHPFDCEAEIELLKDFFGLSEKELRLIIAANIGNDDELKKHFSLPI